MILNNRQLEIIKEKTVDFESAQNRIITQWEKADAVYNIPYEYIVIMESFRILKSCEYRDVLNFRDLKQNYNIAVETTEIDTKTFDACNIRLNEFRGLNANGNYSIIITGTKGDLRRWLSGFYCDGLTTSLEYFEANQVWF